MLHALRASTRANVRNPRQVRPVCFQRLFQMPRTPDDALEAKIKMVDAARRPETVQLNSSKQASPVMRCRVRNLFDRVCGVRPALPK
jgi:hypothetical protein